MSHEDPWNAPRWITAVALIGVVLYLPSLSGPFLNWDDEWLIVENPHLDEIRDLPRILDPTPPRVTLGAEYLPVRDLSLWIDRQLWGLDPIGYHLHNTLLYGMVCALVLLVLRWLTGSPWAAFLGTVLFALHPVHVESVAWVSERKGLLAAMFLLASLLAWRRARAGGGLRWLAGSLGFFVLAAFSKSTVHFAAPLLPAIAWLEARRERRRPRLVAPVLLALAFAAVSAAAIALNAHNQAAVSADYGWEGATAVGAAQIVATGAVRYVAMLLVPVGLSVEYLVESSPAGGGAIVVVVILAAATGIAIRKRSPAAAAAVFAWLAWLPVSNLIALPNRMADRYMFLVSIGVAGVAGVALAAVHRRASRRVLTRGFLVIVAAFAVLSVHRTLAWNSPRALWEDAVAKAPLSARAHQNLGVALHRDGDVEGAFSAWHRMLEVEPSEGAWWVYVASRHQEAGDLDRAESLLRRGMLQAPDSAMTRANLAQLLIGRWLASGRTPGPEAEAESLLREVAESGRWGRDMRAIALLNLGALRFVQGKLDEGILVTRAALEAGLRRADERLALENLVQATRQLGRPEEALRYEARLRALGD